MMDNILNTEQSEYASNKQNAKINYLQEQNKNLQEDLDDLQKSLKLNKQALQLSYSQINSMQQQLIQYQQKQGNLGNQSNLQTLQNGQNFQNTQIVNMNKGNNSTVLNFQQNNNSNLGNQKANSKINNNNENLGSPQKSQIEIQQQQLIENLLNENRVLTEKMEKLNYEKNLANTRALIQEQIQEENANFQKEIVTEQDEKILELRRIIHDKEYAIQEFEKMNPQTLQNGIVLKVREITTPNEQTLKLHQEIENLRYHIKRLTSENFSLQGKNTFLLEFNANLKRELIKIRSVITNPVSFQNMKEYLFGASMSQDTDSLELQKYFYSEYFKNDDDESIARDYVSEIKYQQDLERMQQQKNEKKDEQNQNFLLSRQQLFDKIEALEYTIWNFRILYSRETENSKILQEEISELQRHNREILNYNEIMINSNKQHQERVQQLNRELQLYKSYYYKFLAYIQGRRGRNQSIGSYGSQFNLKQNNSIQALVQSKQELDKQMKKIKNGLDEQKNNDNIRQNQILESNISNGQSSKQKAEQQNLEKKQQQQEQNQQQQKEQQQEQEQKSPQKQKEVNVSILDEGDQSENDMDNNNKNNNKQENQNQGKGNGNKKQNNKNNHLEDQDDAITIGKRFQGNVINNQATGYNMGFHNNQKQQQVKFFQQNDEQQRQQLIQQQDMNLNQCKKYLLNLAKDLYIHMSKNSRNKGITRHILSKIQLGNTSKDTQNMLNLFKSKRSLSDPLLYTSNKLYGRIEDLRPTKLELILCQQNEKQFGQDQNLNQNCDSNLNNAQIGDEFEQQQQFQQQQFNQQNFIKKDMDWKQYDMHTQSEIYNQKQSLYTQVCNHDYEEQNRLQKGKIFINQNQQQQQKEFVLKTEMMGDDEDQIDLLSLQQNNNNKSNKGQLGNNTNRNLNKNNSQINSSQNYKGGFKNSNYLNNNSKINQNNQSNNQKFKHNENNVQFGLPFGAEIEGIEAKRPFHKKKITMQFDGDSFISDQEEFNF